ncbi:ABC transporter G family member 20 [Sarcoptes scabiei]|uniref:ABC transporter G family member 20 n=1 Tax=Sarcoptes scabiei TaxID=52283 RepID=A0A132AA89_SARSC|nr:ABC transporter G family member 20 [Sarcoptes scabiei]KPM07833.1 ABC transporter-like protein 13 [Sarcoptes scabiei]
MNPSAIEIKNLCFSYQKIEVLKNIYMKVPKCSIYALLGPSGSGKTTLLRLMLGRLRPDSGTISIFGNFKAGHFNRIIGYMPQTTALSLEFTIGETIDYFANLYQLCQKDLVGKKKDLREIFCLADDNKLVSELSGGQQKALSLALVFLHSPRLVFLDEPTVGTDPLLGSQIWSFLRQKCFNGLTVIIVTHYIQEASQADWIGMMRSGRIIEEGIPKSLYLKYDDRNLENIFIRICMATTSDGNNNKISDHRNLFGYYHSNQSFDSMHQNKSVQLLSFETNRSDFPCQNLRHHLVMNDYQIDNFENRSTRNGLQSFRYQNQNSFENDRLIDSYSLLWMLFILIRRNISQFMKSKMTSIMLFSPVFCTLLMCITFKLPTAVYNQESFPIYSDRFQSLAKNFTIHHIRYEECRSLEAAIDKVRAGKTIAAIWFDRNFSIAIAERALASIKKFPIELANRTIDKQAVPGNNSDPSTSIDDYEYDDYENLSSEIEMNETIKQSTIKVFIDNSNMYYAQPLMDLFNFGSWDLINEVLRDHDLTPITSPVNVKEVIYAEGTEVPDFLLSGYLIGFLYLSQVTLTSQLLILERKNDFFDRIIVAGADHSLMFFSHFITNLLFSFIQIILMLLIGFVWFRIPNFGSYWLVFILVLLQSTSSIMTGLLISSLCRENFSAFFIALSITLSQLFTSGAMFPIISFDPIIKFFLNITPIAMPVESLRNVMLRGWTILNLNVVHGLITNLVLTLIFGYLALHFFKKRS